MPTLAFIGDVMLGRGVRDELRRRRAEQYAELWGMLLPVLQSADGVIANLECAITRCQRRWTATPKVFHFRADVSAVDVLRAGNIKCVTLANNHTLDYGYEGLRETLRYLDLADIAHAGAGENLQQAETPAVLDVDDLRVGVISLTDNEPPFAAGPDRPGTNYLPIRTDAETMGRVEGWIRAARSAGADLIVVSPHWGPNMIVRPPRAHVDFAREVLRRGADMVFGHSAHVFQAVELYDGKPIIYDASDILDDYAIDPHMRNDWSFAFVFELDGRRLQRVRMIPVRLSYARVDVAQGEELEAIRDRMIGLCRAFKTPLLRTPEGLELTIRTPVSGAI